MQDQPEKNAFAVTETAQALRLRSQSVYALLRDGLLSGEKKGRDWMISAEEVERYKLRRRLRRVAGRKSLKSGAIEVKAAAEVRA